MNHHWVDCDRNSVMQRYDRIAKFIPLFEWLLFLPRDLRRKAVLDLGLRRGDSVLESGCGTGRNFPHLREAVGPAGRIYGIDISPGMLDKARHLRDVNHWHNIELHECDGADFTAPTPLDGVLFSLSYNSMMLTASPQSDVRSCLVDAETKRRLGPQLASFAEANCALIRSRRRRCRALGLVRPQYAG